MTELVMPQLEELSSVIQTVMADFLGIRIHQIDNDQAEEGANTPSGARVFISGEWEGAIRLAVSEDLASRIASTMFRVPENGVTNEQVEDAIGELVNIIGGNVKALLPGPSSLSLPIQGVEVEDGSFVCGVHFSADEQHHLDLAVYA